MTGSDAENENCRITVLYEDDDVLVFVKPAGMPTAPITADDSSSALTAAAAVCPAVLSVHGKKDIEGGLLHRIDTATTGLVLMAKNQTAWDFISAEQESLRFIKTYTAFCYHSDILPGAVSAGKIPCTIKSLFRPYGEGRCGVKPVFETSGRADRKKAGNREYVTELISEKPVDSVVWNKEIVKVQARIAGGYRHQVRAHLAALGLPVLGDSLYPALWNTGETAPSDLPLYFFATGLSVSLPGGRKLSLEMPESFLFPLPDKKSR